MMDWAKGQLGEALKTIRMSHDTPGGVLAETSFMVFVMFCGVVVLGIILLFLYKLAVVAPMVIVGAVAGPAVVTGTAWWLLNKSGL